MFPCVQSDGTSYIFLSSSFFWQSSQTLATMKTISLAALSLLLLSSSQLDRTEAVSLRQAEETVELPEDFDCKLCSKCGWVVVNTSPSTELLIFRQSCTLQCNLCSGCDLLKAFDVSRELYPSAVLWRVWLWLLAIFRNRHRTSGLRSGAVRVRYLLQWWSGGLQGGVWAGPEGLWLL